MDKLLDAYLKANPNVKIERTVVSQSNIRDQVRLAFQLGMLPMPFTRGLQLLFLVDMLRMVIYLI